MDKQALEKKATLLFKQKRHLGTGSTLNVENINLLLELWGKTISKEGWASYQQVLNDKTPTVAVLKEHDWELLKALRSFVQSGNQIIRMLNDRAGEVNKLIEENKELFEQLAAANKADAESPDFKNVVGDPGVNNETQ